MTHRHRYRPPRSLPQAIADLEAAAVALHCSGQPTRGFWLKHWRALGVVAKQGPATYTATVQRLHHLLASGDAPQAQAVVPAVADVTTEAATPEATR